jgi:hypothetical protein
MGAHPKSDRRRDDVYGVGRGYGVGRDLGVGLGLGVGVGVGLGCTSNEPISMRPVENANKRNAALIVEWRRSEAGVTGINGRASQ